MRPPPEIPGREIIGDRIARHIGHGVCLGDRRRLEADDDGKLGLPIDLARTRRQPHAAAGTGDAMTDLDEMPGAQPEGVRIGRRLFALCRAISAAWSA